MPTLTGKIYFYPRSPCGERPSARITQSGLRIFLSTLSLRRATGFEVDGLLRVRISIHALLAENDPARVKCRGKGNVFLSTLSLRRATGSGSAERLPCYFYPRSPCGERQDGGNQPFFWDAFLSTLSLRRATVGFRRLAKRVKISIHALLAESDKQARHVRKGDIKFLSTLSLRRATAFRSPRIALMVDFYPRSPCGERPLCFVRGCLFCVISIHALLAESDCLLVY